MTKVCFPVVSIVLKVAAKFLERSDVMPVKHRSMEKGKMFISSLATVYVDWYGDAMRYEQSGLVLCTYSFFGEHGQ